MALALVLVGCALIVVGVGLVFPPAGLIVAGLLCMSAAYVWRYMEVRAREVSRTSR